MAAGSTYTPIATTTLGSAQASVTFSSLGSYTDLVLVVNCTTASDSNVLLRFNSDTGTNYSNTTLDGTGSAATSYRYTNQTSIYLTNQAYAQSSTQFNSIANIMNYGNATTYKTVICRSNNSATGTDAIVNLWRSTSAITSITILGNANFNSASTFTLYGIASA